MDFGSFTIKNERIVITRAPEPDDILWENSDKPRKKVFRNKVLSMTCGVILLLLGGGVQYLLDYLQQKVGSGIIVTLYSIASSISITLFNWIIVQFLVFVTHLEGNETTTLYNRSLLIKICLFEFFNAGIFSALANILSVSVDKFNIQGDFSFEITFFMLMNALVPSASTFLMVYF